ncbi:hypothetical protein WDZ92_38020, partial [Nostoc sp. NIES-2111]
PNTRAVTPPPAPVVKVWGAATATTSTPRPYTPNETAPSPSAPAATPTPKPAAPTNARIEEPPALAPTKSEIAIKPAIQPLPQAPPPEKRGFFRRLARGVKNLNPVKRDNASEPNNSAAPAASNNP